MLQDLFVGFVFFLNWLASIVTEMSILFLSDAYILWYFCSILLIDTFYKFYPLYAGNFLYHVKEQINQSLKE